MRQVLVDTARARSSEKRASGQEVALADLPELGIEAESIAVGDGRRVTAP